MSDGRQPEPPALPVKPWHPVLRAFLFLVGFVLLLPGICTVFMVFERSDLTGFWPLWVICLAISYGGVRVIENAWRGHW